MTFYAVITHSELHETALAALENGCGLLPEYAQEYLPKPGVESVLIDFVDESGSLIIVREENGRWKTGLVLPKMFNDEADAWAIAKQWFERAVAEGTREFADYGVIEQLADGRLKFYALMR